MSGATIAARTCPPTDSFDGELLQDGEDVLEEIELQCQCGSHLLVLAEEIVAVMTSDSLEDSPASLTMVTLLFLPKSGLARTMSYSPAPTT